MSIHKDYKFNFLREDSFELLKMPNVGHSYNRLGYSFTNMIDYPKLGARGKHFHYFEVEDIGYYNVPTPFTEIFAKSTFEQGQVLDALVSINLSPDLLALRNRSRPLLLSLVLRASSSSIGSWKGVSSPAKTYRSMYLS